MTSGSGAKLMQGRREQPMRRVVGKLAAVLVPLAVLGHAGHQFLQRLDQTLAHHLFHVLFGAGAAVAFAGFVVADIRRNGRPSFSWRLRA